MVQSSLDELNFGRVCCFIVRFDSALHKVHREEPFRVCPWNVQKRALKSSSRASELV